MTEKTGKYRPVDERTMLAMRTTHESGAAPLIDYTLRVMQLRPEQFRQLAFYLTASQRDLRTTGNIPGIKADAADQMDAVLGIGQHSNGTHPPHPVVTELRAQQSLAEMRYNAVERKRAECQPHFASPARPKQWQRKFGKKHLQQ